MATYSEILQNYVNQSYDSLVRIAKKAYNDAWPVLNRYSKSGDSSDLIVAIFSSTIAIDGKFSELEYDFMKDVLEISYSYSDLKSVVSQYTSPEWLKTIDTIVDSFDRTTKSNIVTLCVCIASVDTTITRAENEFIQRLLID